MKTLILVKRGDYLLLNLPYLHKNLFLLFLWWAWLELNQRPIGYEPTALTPELQAYLKLEGKMAEGMGFEPTEPERVHSLSRGAHSTTLAPFQIKFFTNGGETGIRTLGALTDTTVFKTAAFDHSAISPNIEK